MIQEGQKKKARYWGNFEVEKVATLKQPVMCYSSEKGQVKFMPTIVKIKWETAPSPDKNNFWFPYWVTIDGKEKYGQFAPMVGSNALLNLFNEAINKDFFDKEFLQGLAGIIKNKLQK